MAREIDYTKPLSQETVDYLKARVPMETIQRLIDQVGLKKGAKFELSGSVPAGVVVENGDDSVPPPPPEPVKEELDADGKSVENGSDAPPEDLI